MASLTGKDILLIDDAEEVRVLAGRILTGDGANVIPAEGVDQALNLARQKIPHLLVMDLEMPLKNGFDLLEIKQKDPTLKDIPVIVLSGMKDKQSVQKAISLGASDYILKPFRATLLLQKVRKALKLSSFLKRVIHDSTLAKAVMSVPVEIVRISESGCQIDCSVKLGSNENVQLVSELLKSLDLDKIKMNTVGQGPQFAATGRYLCDINFVGIDPEIAKKIRNRGVS